jgi:hypothetical protein
MPLLAPGQTGGGRRNGGRLGRVPRRCQVGRQSAPTHRQMIRCQGLDQRPFVRAPFGEQAMQLLAKMIR